MDHLTPEEVREFRQREGLLQKELSAKLGLRHKDSLRAWETGKRNIGGPASLAIRLIQALREAGDDTANAILEALWTGA